MKLVRLAVQRFQCIEEAELDFGPGLNVLYGPNDLGKSSLAWAVRAVLLLQHNSAQHERFVSWYGGGEPRVALTFTDEDGRYWRVTKTFAATSGRSQLETSKDGRTFTTDASGRQVDEKLRAMLGWGIPAPGGAGGTRGLPSSFLSQVLLAEQDSVRDVLFNASLADDPDESGRLRLVEALGALAQDPLFKQILDDAQEKVDEAFTAKGNRKRGAGSPFKDISDRVKELHAEREALVGRLRDTQLVEEQIRQRTAERDELGEELAEARTELARAEKQLALARRLGAIDQVAEGRATLKAAGAKLADIAKRAAAATAAVEAAETARETARAALDKLADDPKLERERARLVEATKTTTEALATTQGEVRRTTDAVAEVRKLAASLDEVTRLAAATKASAGGDDSKLVAVNGERDVWAAVAVAARTRLRAEEAAAKKKLPKRVPSAAAIAELRTLREELRIAEARLEVGLSVQIRPKAGVAVRVKRDGGKELTSKPGAPQSVTAKRVVTLAIDDVVELEIEAGEAEARAEAATLRERWEALAAEHGETTVEELEQQRAAAEVATKAIEDARRQAELLDGYEDVELDELARDEVESRLKRIKGDVAATIRTKLNELDKERTRLLAATEKERAEYQTVMIAAETRIADLREKLGGDPKAAVAARQQALEAATTAQRAAKTAADAATEALATFDRQRAATTKAAREALAKAETGARDARAAADALGKQHRELAAQVHQAELQVAQWQAGAEELDAATLAALRAELEELGGAEIEEADVEHLRQSAARIERRVRELEGELQKHRGALEQVGGAIVRERQRELDEAIALAEQREAEISVEYDAWKLLVETMRDAESTEGAHLGKALGGAVSQRFAELTGGRYGAVELGTHLESASLQAAGELRDPAALSAGTQDQLATLLRLCVAEQLKSSIVLDDHLSQSDANRVTWFNGVLRRAAEQIQIVLITCRPGEVLAASELPTGSDAARNLAAGRLRVIDLTRIIKRASAR